MSEAQKKIIEHYIHSYNSFDVEGMTRNLHSDIVFENVSGGRVNLSTRGIEAFRQQAESAKDFFSQREQKVTSWEFSGPIVTVGIDYRGVAAVDLPNGMKAGDTLRLEGRSVFEFKDGRIVKIRDES